VWIERFNSQGVLRSLGNILNITTDRNTPVSVAWREVPSAPGSRWFDEASLIIGRSVILNTSDMIAGDYNLEVVMKVEGRDPLRSRRSITIRER
jgi:hypothetical protein